MSRYYQKAGGLLSARVQKSITHHGVFDSFCFFLAVFSLQLWGLRWFWGLHPLGWLGLSNLLSLLAVGAGWGLWAGYAALAWTLLWSLTLWLQHRYGAWIWLCVPIVWWLGFTGLSHTPLGLPWWTPATLAAQLLALWPGPERIPALPEWVGSVVMGWVCCALSFVRHSLMYRLTQWAVGALLWMLCMLALACSLPAEHDGLLSEYSPSDAWRIFLQGWPIRLVQGNPSIAQIRDDRLSVGRRFRGIIQHMQANAPTGTLWILPEEGGLPGTVPLDDPRRNPWFAAWQDWAILRQQFLLTGATTQEINGRTYNTALLFYPNGRWHAWHKRHLVPFGEVAPWGLGTLMTAISGYTPDFSPGTASLSPVLLRWPGRRTLQLWPLICSEAMDPEHWPALSNHPSIASSETPLPLVAVLCNLGWFQQAPNPVLTRQWWQLIRWRARQTVGSQAAVVVVGDQGPTGVVQR